VHHALERYQKLDNIEPHHLISCGSTMWLEYGTEEIMSSVGAVFVDDVWSRDDCFVSRC
jgi:hypothetical protein